MESLQFAQVLADLSTLQNTEPQAATALLTAPSTLNPKIIRRKSRASTLPDPPKFDKLGRRIVRPGKPLLNRMDSNLSTTSATSTSTSGATTPAERALSQSDTDEDMKRAKTLLELFEMRGKFKQMGDTGLVRAKERVDAVVARYAKKDLEERERVARSRHLGP